LKLRFERIKTPFRHYTLIGDGVVRAPNEEYRTVAGPAIMSMKTWAENEVDAFDLFSEMGRTLGFEAKGRIQLYDTEPERPPEENRFGYDVRFVPYSE
jgi:hypothetical protein